MKWLNLHNFTILLKKFSKFVKCNLLLADLMSVAHHSVPAHQPELQQRHTKLQPSPLTTWYFTILVTHQQQTGSVKVHVRKCRICTADTSGLNCRDLEALLLQHTWDCWNRWLEWWNITLCLDLQTGAVGDRINLLIPLIDCGSVDARNILGIIVTWTQYSAVMGWWPPTPIYVDYEKEVWLRTAIIAYSAFGRHWLVKCSCKRRRKCHENECKYLQETLLPRSSLWITPVIISV